MCGNRGELLGQDVEDAVELDVHRVGSAWSEIECSSALTQPRDDFGGGGHQVRGVVGPALPGGTARGSRDLPPLKGMAKHYGPRMSRIFTTSFASVYPHYVTKVEK
jgi:hypothetical protein